MNSQHDDLSRLLQSWQPELQPATDLRRAVWSRIETEEGRKISVVAPFVAWLQLLAMPRIALSAATIALVAGMLIGTLQARNSQEAQYLLSLNPYRAASTVTQR